MPRIAILGANGQVGAELCLLLARIPGVDVVPICRSRSGSAFLRWKGIRCRHGRAAVTEEARSLFADCDVIVNSALASGTPAEMRRAEDAIVRNISRYSGPNAIVIHFSTQSVYGDARPGRIVKWRSLYGRAKLATERYLLSQARASGRRAYALRLGHVCGALQEISNNVRREISEERVILPAVDVPSNTVYTVTIVDAVLTIARGDLKPGWYDLMNKPQWTWREVYEYEARSCGQDLHATVVPGYGQVSIAAAMRGLLRPAFDVAATPFVRHLVGAVLARLPERANARGQAWWYCKRARTEIAALSAPLKAPEHLSWGANGTRFIEELARTSDLLAQCPYQELLEERRGAWANDLGPADTRLPGAAESPATST